MSNFAPGLRAQYIAKLNDVAADHKRLLPFVGDRAACAARLLELDADGLIDLSTEPALRFVVHDALIVHCADVTGPRHWDGTTPAAPRMGGTRYAAPRHLATTGA